MQSSGSAPHKLKKLAELVSQSTQATVVIAPSFRRGLGFRVSFKHVESNRQSSLRSADGAARSWLAKVRTTPTKFSYFNFE